MKHILKNAGTDISASLVVFLVALPLCLGIALGSGAPLFSGIIAGIVGGIVIGILSGSNLSVSGPAAGLTAIVAVGISELPVYEAFLLSVVIAGCFQLVFGFIKAGFLGDFVPTNVIKGMLTAIGIILILKQIPHFIGYDSNFEGDEAFKQDDSQNTFSEIFEALGRITPLALIIGVLSLGIQILWEKVLVHKSRIFKLVPAPLVVVLAAIAIQLACSGIAGFQLNETQLVKMPVSENISEFASFFTMPDFSYISLPVVWKTGLILAIVASLETLLSIEAADALDPLKNVTPTNRELLAQGTGNIISGLLGGLPVTSVIVRTSANVNAGAKSKLSAIMHGVLLLLSVLFIPDLINLIPLSALAGILIYTGFKLAKPAIFIEMYKKGWDQIVPFVVTVIAIILTDLLEGIVIGIIVGLFYVVRSNFRSAVFIINDADKYLFRLRKDVSFLNKSIVKNKLESVPQNSFIIIDASRADFIDKDIIEVINDFMKHAHIKNIQVEVKKSNFKSSHNLIKEQSQFSII